MRGQPTYRQIAGVGLVVFFAVLLGVGVRHVFALPTCSSDGYMTDYGPVPTCPGGTGWWMLFTIGGLIGAALGALIAGRKSVAVAALCGAIGLGCLSVVLDSQATTGDQVFGAIFGLGFAIVGAVVGGAVIRTAIGSLRAAPEPPTKPGVPAATPVLARQAVAIFGPGSEHPDPIASAYRASASASVNATPRSPLDLAPGLRALRQAAGGGTVGELATLAKLHSAGALSDEEFTVAKAKLLGRSR
jgi:hypothetical protein